MKRYLGIIPARGGSKGIKNKNITDICGIPLIEYTINSALKLYKNGVLDELIVSTDSEEIALISRKAGVNVPFLRPKNISKDRSKSIEFILHALDYFEKKRTFFDAVIILQPTSPLREYKDIINAINIFDRSQNDSLISCWKEEDIFDTKMYYKSSVYGIPLNKNHNKGTRRQELKNIYIRNGAIFITSIGYLRKYSQVISDKPLIYIMPKSRSLDLNTKEDLELARALLKVKNS